MSKQYRSAHLTRRLAEAGLNKTPQPAAATTTRNYPLLPKPLSTKRRPATRKIAISTISLAEVVYLIEKNRLPPSAYDELTQALADPEHVFTEAVLSAAIVQAMRQVSHAEVPDMPDRMVAATAVYFDVPVISRDRRIRAASLKTIW
jgi:PIN domain nuclease of toxin-antitoxin system